MSTWADAEDEPPVAQAPVEEQLPVEQLSMGGEEVLPKTEVKVAPPSKPVEVVESSCDASWTSEELVSKCCDLLVASGRLRSTPGFIRTDREAKLVKIFSAAKLDGAKMATFANARELEVMIRNATEGESWVDDVQQALKTFLPAGVQLAKVELKESDEVKKAKENYRERMASGTGRPAQGGGGGGGGDDANYASFGGRSGGGGGGGGDRACYNCGEAGHISRECPNAPGGGAGRDAAFSSFGGRGGGDRACFNCGEPGHISRECPNGPGGGGGRGQDPAFASFGGGGGGGGMECYGCGQVGHTRRECPNEQGGGGYGGGGDKNCFNCGNPGHMARDCPDGQR